MTAKERANSLINRHEAYIESHCNQSSRLAHYNAAVQCALITTEEIINELNTQEEYTRSAIQKIEYHEQVKIYIEAIWKGDLPYLDGMNDEYEERWVDHDGGKWVKVNKEDGKI